MKNKILMGLSALMGLGLIVFGANKFFDFMPKPENVSAEMAKDFGAFMEISWLMPLTGAMEIVAGILLIFPRTRLVGALVFLPMLVGIVLNNTVVDASGLPVALVFVAITGWVLFDGKDKLLGLLK